MNCPQCKTTYFKKDELSEGLIASRCPTCEGHWIPSFNYWKWLHKQGAALPEKDMEQPLEVTDSKAAKCCPECSQIMGKFRVGHGTEFLIERCGSCAGMWFDKNEWETLAAKNLHDEIHFIFGQPWQSEIIETRIIESRENKIKELIGNEKFNELKLLKTWLAGDKNKSAILGYLQAD